MLPLAGAGADAMLPLAGAGAAAMLPLAGAGAGAAAMLPFAGAGAGAAAMLPFAGAGAACPLSGAADFLHPPSTHAAAKIPAINIRCLIVVTASLSLGSQPS